MYTNRFKDKVALVTGGASGIGAATVRRFVAEGARVMIADLNSEWGNALASELGPDNSSFMTVDVSDEAAVINLVKQTIENFGRIDILVNNAGIGHSAKTPDIGTEDWLRVVSVNLHAVFYACKAVIPQMRAQGGGTIVNTASISGLGGDLTFGAYNASKGAVVNYTRTLAMDHGPDNIRTNAVCPGAVDTPIIAPAFDLPGVKDAYARAVPLRRVATSEDIAAAILFLASDDARHINGVNLPVDGGMTASAGQPDLIELATNAMLAMAAAES